MAGTADFRGIATLDALTGKWGSASRVDVQLLYSEDFESSLPAAWSAYNGSTAEIITDTAQNYSGSAGSLKATYPTPAGEVYVVGSYDLAPYCALGSTNHVYIDFYAKMPNSKQGLKFCKIFGEIVEAGNYANTTFGLDYTGVERGGMVYIGFGDGVDVGNDTNNGLWLDGTNDTVTDGHGPGRSEGLIGYSVSTPQSAPWLASDWGTAWHRFQLHVKFNSGTTEENEINDGELDVIIDGVTYATASGIFNRHYSNGPINYLHLFEYAQTGTAGFDIWIDSLRISQNGWTR